MKKNALITLFLSFFICAAQATLLVVNSNEDVIQVDNNCTLREAITAANFDISVDQCGTGLGDDLIWVLLGTSGDAIQLNNQLGIIDGVEIQGPGADNLVLFPANGHTGHIFQINTDRDVTFKDFRIGGAQSSAVDVVEVGNLTIEDMRFINNSTASTEKGGALNINTPSSVDFSENRTILISNSEFSNNQALQGGAINIEENYLLHVENSVFDSNVAVELQGAASYGSAISKSTDDLSFVLRDADTIMNSQFLNHGAMGSNKSVLALSYQNFVVDQTVFIDNHDSPISASSGLGLVKNSLFTGTTDEHAILSYFNTGEITVLFSTFFDNNKAIGTSQNATVYVKGNIFDGDGCDENVTATSGSILSLGYNIEDNISQNLSCTSQPTDLADTDPMLLPLSTYGGNIPYAPLSPISPAVDTAQDCDSNDLSGEGRARDGDGSGGLGQCDMGAVERPNAYGLSVSFPGNGDGTVSLSDYSLYCNTPNTCLWPLPQNESYTFQANAQNGSVFDSWGNSCTGSGSCDITMDGFKFLSANFTLLNAPVTLTVEKHRTENYLDVIVTSNPSGISCDPTCEFDFDENETVVLTANPESSAVVVDYWDGCDIESQDGLECTVFLGSNPQTIDIYLDKNPDIIFKNTFD